MEKGGMSQGGSGEDGVEENMAAWLLGVNSLKIQPFHLPPLGMQLFFLIFYSTSFPPFLLSAFTFDKSSAFFYSIFSSIFFLAI